MLNNLLGASNIVVNKISPLLLCVCGLYSREGR